MRLDPGVTSRVLLPSFISMRTVPDGVTFFLTNRRRATSRRATTIITAIAARTVYIIALFP